MFNLFGYNTIIGHHESWSKPWNASKCHLPSTIKCHEQCKRMNSKPNIHKVNVTPNCIESDSICRRTGKTARNIEWKLYDETKFKFVGILPLLHFCFMKIYSLPRFYDIMMLMMMQRQPTTKIIIICLV